MSIVILGSVVPPRNLSYRRCVPPPGQGSLALPRCVRGPEPPSSLCLGIHSVATVYCIHCFLAIQDSPSPGRRVSSDLLVGNGPSEPLFLCHQLLHLVTLQTPPLCISPYRPYLPCHPSLVSGVSICLTGPLVSYPDSVLFNSSVLDIESLTCVHTLHSPSSVFCAH